MKKDIILWNKPYFIGVCIMQVIYGIFSMFAAVMLNNVATAVGNAATIGELMRAGLPTVFFGFIYAGSRLLADGLMQEYGERAGESLRSSINRKIFAMDNAGFSSQDSGSYLNRMTGDVLLIRDQYYTQLPQIFCFIAQFVFCVIYSFYLNEIVAIVLIAFSVLQYFVPTLFGKKINELMVGQSEQTSVFTSKAKELLGGFSVIKSFRAVRSIQEEFDTANHQMTDARKKAMRMTQTMYNANLLIGWLMITSSVLAAGCFVVRGDLAAGTILTVFYIANRYSMPVMDFAAACTNIKGNKGVREKLRKFLEEETPKAEASVLTEKRNNGVSLVHTSFAYPGGEPVLQDINFCFLPRKKYLILGESGCGKSTLLKLMAGLYPAKGILVNGMDICGLEQEENKRIPLLVGQQPYLFHRTIAENIDFLKTGNRTAVMEAAKSCCLEEFLETLPEGIDTMVDEEQRQLSGGQKARIGLARAIFAKPEVLLLDEVTAALDSDTARKIEQMVLELPDTTVIHVSHKSSKELMEQYDTVLTMDGGRIVTVVEN